jgi:hypothetical protein
MVAVALLKPCDSVRMHQSYPEPGCYRAAIARSEFANGEIGSLPFAGI